MKRIFAVLTSIMLFLNLSLVTAFAEDSITADDNITLNIDFDGTLKAYTVSGFVDSERDRIPMSLVVKHENGKILNVAEVIAVGKTADGVGFSFEKFPLSSSALSGNIEFKVTAGYLGYVATQTIEYCGPDRQLTELIKLKAAIDSVREAASNEDTLKSAIISSKEILSVVDDDYKVFAELSDVPGNLNDASSVALRNIAALELDLPDGFGTAEEGAQINKQIEAYHIKFKEAIELGRFFDLSTNEAIKSWYDANKTKYGFLTDDIETAVDDTKLLPYFDEVITRDDYASRIDNMRFVSTMKELNIEMKKQAVLQMIADSNQNIINRVITELAPMLADVYDENGANPLSFDVFSWNSLSEDEQITVSVEIAGESYKNLYAFIKDLNKAIEDVDSDDTHDYKESSRPSRAPVTISKQETTVAPVVVFEDIEGVAWAKDAIHYLYKNKIIAGRDEKTFAPNDNMTRAELAKVLVLAFRLDGEGAKAFNDVNDNVWYAPYVKIAAANGLIMGDGSGSFNPDKPVSRQDAAVMMYRAIGVKAQSKNADFTDYMHIAPYAVDAVNYMFEKGIVNGVGDGRFAPLANITRAEAAKMLYSLLVA